MTRDEIYANAGFLTLAGAETTSNSLAVISYMISTNPRVQAQITRELLLAFTCGKEIDMRSAGKLPYLMAVIEETLRFHPPGPNTMYRTTPPDGNWILGDWVPGNVSFMAQCMSLVDYEAHHVSKQTILGIPHRVMYRDERNFTRPDEFIPERWLSNEKGGEFANDRRDCFHPFQYGPRMCLAMK